MVRRYSRFLRHHLGLGVTTLCSAVDYLQADTCTVTSFVFFVVPCDFAHRTYPLYRNLSYLCNLKLVVPCCFIPIMSHINRNKNQIRISPYAMYYFVTYTLSLLFTIWFMLTVPYTNTVIKPTGYLSIKLQYLPVPYVLFLCLSHRQARSPIRWELYGNFRINSSIVSFFEIQHFFPLGSLGLHVTLPTLPLWLPPFFHSSFYSYFFYLTWCALISINQSEWSLHPSTNIILSTVNVIPIPLVI